MGGLVGGGRHDEKTPVVFPPGQIFCEFLRLGPGSSAPASLPPIPPRLHFFFSVALVTFGGIRALFHTVPKETNNAYRRKLYQFYDGMETWSRAAFQTNQSQLLRNVAPIERLFLPTGPHTQQVVSDDPPPPWDPMRPCDSLFRIPNGPNGRLRGSLIK